MRAMKTNAFVTDFDEFQKCGDVSLRRSDRRHHQAGGDPDARLERDGFEIEATDRVDDAQPRPDRPLGIVLMCSAVAEIDQDTVAHVLGDKAIQRQRPW